MEPVAIVVPIVALIVIIAVFTAMWKFGYFRCVSRKKSDSKLDDNRISTASDVSNAPFRSESAIPPVPTIDRKYISSATNSSASSGTLSYPVSYYPDSGVHRTGFSTLNPAFGNTEFELSRHSVATATSQNTVNFPPRKMSRDTVTLGHVRSNSTGTLHSLYQTDKEALKGQPTYEEIKMLHQRGHEAWKFSLEEDDAGMAFTGMTTSGNGFVVKYGQQKQGERSCLSNLPLHRDPLNPHRQFYYFEVTVKELDPDSIVAIGLATKPYPPDLMLGRENFSTAILSDDGSILRDGARTRTAFANAFEAPTVIGCGYDTKLETIFYTMNGEWLGNAATNEPLRPYHAAVSANGPSVLLINVGQHPFKFEPANPPPGEQVHQDPAPTTPKIRERSASRSRTPKPAVATVADIPSDQQPQTVQAAEGVTIEIKQRSSSRSRTPKQQQAPVQINAIPIDPVHIERVDLTNADRVYAPPIPEYIPNVSSTDYDTQDRSQRIQNDRAGTPQQYNAQRSVESNTQKQYQQQNTNYPFPNQTRRPSVPENKYQFQQPNYPPQSGRPSEPDDQTQRQPQYSNSPSQNRRPSGPEQHLKFQPQQQVPKSILNKSQNPSGPDSSAGYPSQSRRPSGSDQQTAFQYQQHSAQSGPSKSRSPAPEQSVNYPSHSRRPTGPEEQAGFHFQQQIAKSIPTKSRSPSGPDQSTNYQPQSRKPSGRDEQIAFQSQPQNSKPIPSRSRNPSAPDQSGYASQSRRPGQQNAVPSQTRRPSDYQQPSYMSNQQPVDTQLQAEYQNFSFAEQDQFSSRSRNNTAQRYQTVPEKKQNVAPEQSYDGMSYPQSQSEEPDIYERYLMSLSRLQKQQR